MTEASPGGPAEPSAQGRPLDPSTETDSLSAHGPATKAGAPVPSPAPGPALVLAATAFLMLPLGLAAALPALPAWLGGYLPAMPLPLLVVETALVFACFALPAFAAPGGGLASPALTGLARGLCLAALALPFCLAARIASPVPAGVILAGCALTASAGAGCAAAAAALGVRGLAVGVAVMTLPGLVGFFGTELELPLGWFSGLCPFASAWSALHGGASWTPGLLPGIALLVIGQFLGRRVVQTCPPARNA